MGKFDKNVKFNLEDIVFSEKEGRFGEFDGPLVNYNHEKLGHGIFKFKKGSMKTNNGKTLAMMYNHDGAIIPVGTMSGVDSQDGFNIVGNFHLTKDGDNYINPEAAKLYSLMKDMGYKFDMSVGGTISKFTERTTDGKYVVEIEEFIAHEGSLTPKGAIEGSGVKNVFSDNFKEENSMDPKQMEAMKVMFGEQFKQFQETMLAAQTDEEIKALPGKFKAMEEQFKTMGETFNAEVKESFEAKFGEINEVIKGLKSNFTATKEETTDAEAFFAMLQEVDKHGKGSTQVFNAETELQFATPTSGNTPNAIKAQYVTNILKRLQAKNNVVSRITFLPTNDNSMFIPREMAGLPECGIIGEVAERVETDGVKLDNVTVNMYQFYCMPFVSNRLLATNFVGYLNFLMSRVEYAWALFISNKLFTGTGVNQPFGILKDTAITNEVELSKAVTDAVLADFIIDIYYSVRTEIANRATWDMTRKSWARIAKIKNTNKDFYITDLNTGNERTLMGRPVNLIEDNALSDITTAAAGDHVMTFGFWEEGIIGLVNNNLDIKIEDRITQKGVTKYWMEKLLGWAIQLPENFIRVKAKA